MKKIKTWLTPGFGRYVIEESFEVEDDASEAEIDEIAKELVFDQIDWGWEEVKDCRKLTN